MASLLCICDQGYRAATEEQDDTVVWMAHMLCRCADTQTALLLRGSAVSYANRAQQPVPVRFGDWVQKNPADFPRDLARYQADGGRVFVLREDLEARGLGDADLVEGAVAIDRDAVAGLVAEFDHVSFW